MASQILTDRLILRPITADDSARVVEILGDFRVAQWTASIPHPFAVRDLRILEPNGDTRWPDMMGIQKDGILIGAVSCTREFGYYLAPEMWGQGIATEAGAAKITHVFETTNAILITAGVFDHNAASRRVLEKLGFQATGSERKHCTAQGADLNSTIMQLSRTDWAAIQ
jgi:RimJ/RimL family protein N-acetyltransferase